MELHGRAILRAYVDFCLMHSPQFEAGLDGIAKELPLQPIKQLFRKRADDKKTARQVIHNSLGRANFKVSEDLRIFTFLDRDSRTMIDSELLYRDLCPQVMRFYRTAWGINGVATRRSSRGREA
jgi:hypothetical protein